MDLLVGQPEKAERLLHWKRRTTFKDLVRLMVDADREILEMERRGEMEGIYKGR